MVMLFPAILLIVTLLIAISLKAAYLWHVSSDRIHILSQGSEKL